MSYVKILLFKINKIFSENQMEFCVPKQKLQQFVHERARLSKEMNLLRCLAIIFRNRLNGFKGEKVFYCACQY